MEVVCVPLSDIATAIGVAATLSRQMTTPAHARWPSLRSQIDMSTIIIRIEIR